VSALLASSLIDAELFIIPLEITWWMAGIGFVIHTIIDRPTLPGALNLESPVIAAASLGGGVGLLISLGLWYVGKMPQSFPQGEPMLDIDREMYAREAAAAKAKGETVEPLPPEYTSTQIRLEMAKEMLFLSPPMLMAIIAMTVVVFVPAIGESWTGLMKIDYATGFLGALWGACIGAFIVWFFRIAGTLVFGRVAMGLGDVHLMFGVGAIIGALPSVAAFFLAPFFAILLHVWLLIIRGKRELPYGPYLSLATAFVLVFSCPVTNWLTPGLAGLAVVLKNMFSAS
jgi:leader peptidase (prepilin peptidase)/N-methyltransferase